MRDSYLLRYTIINTRPCICTLAPSTRPLYCFAMRDSELPLDINDPKTLQYPAISLHNLPTPPPTEDDNLRSPRVSAILRAFQLHRAGKLSKSAILLWRKFALSAAEYCQLRTILQHDVSLYAYVQCKIRYDYFPRQQQLVLRMPSNLHDLYVVYVVQEIKNQLNRVGAGESASADFARRILHCATANIEPLDLDYGLHSPDASFRHDASVLPGVILEVSYSQKRKDLQRLADEYILGSNRNIKVMVGLDLEYNGYEATLSVWKPAMKAEPDGFLYLEAEQVVVYEVQHIFPWVAILMRCTLISLVLSWRSSQYLRRPSNSTGGFCEFQRSCTIPTTHYRRHTRLCNTIMRLTCHGRAATFYGSRQNRPD